MFLIFFLLAAVFAAYLPGFKISYYGEDVLLHLPQAAGPFRLQELWVLHAEHFIPLMKLLYRFCYQLFWMDPRPFHFILTVIACLCVWVIYKFLFRMTGSFAAALSGAFLFGFSTLYDSAVVEICNAQTLLCLLFTALLLYSIGEYFETRRKKWMWQGILSGFFAPCTFAFGVLAGVWGALYYFCCVSREGKPGCRKDLPDLAKILSGWLAGVVLYGLHFRDVVYYGLAPETGVINKAFHLSSLNMGALALRNIWDPLAIHLYPFPAVSLVLLAVCVLLLPGCFSKAAGKKALFFLVWIAVHYFIVGMTRHMPEAIYPGARHHLFPVMGLSCFYAVVLPQSVSFLQNNKIQARKFFVYLLVAVLCVFSAYTKALSVQARYPQGASWKLFYEGFRGGVSGYLEKSGASKICIEDKTVMFDAVFIFPASLSFLSEFILPPELHAQVQWCPRTDSDFLAFLKEKSLYQIFFMALSGRQYFPI